MLNLPELIRLITGEKHLNELKRTESPPPRVDRCGHAYRLFETSNCLYRCGSPRTCSYKLDMNDGIVYCRKMLMIGGKE